MYRVDLSPIIPFISDYKKVYAIANIIETNNCCCPKCSHIDYVEIEDGEYFEEGDDTEYYNVDGVDFPFKINDPIYNNYDLIFKCSKCKTMYWCSCGVY